MIIDWQKLVKRPDVFVLGVVQPGYPGEFERFIEWRQSGYHGDLAYLEKNDHVRSNPQELLPNARSCIVFALRYQPAPAKDAVKFPVAGYALIRDYHRQLKQIGRSLADGLQREVSENQNFQFRVVVDSAPILERALAKQTRMGFIGKNTMYIHPKLGSYLLIGELITNIDLSFDRPADVLATERTRLGGCGTCKRCQVFCPTGALDQDYRLDARLCLSYWSIEHRGLIPYRFWAHFSESIFGCDICQKVCPYNRVGLDSIDLYHDSEFKRRINSIDPVETALMDQAFYEKIFGGSALTRAKLPGLRRNALIHLTVTHHGRLSEILEFCLRDTDPVVQETAAMAEGWISAGGGT